MSQNIRSLWFNHSERCVMRALGLEEFTSPVEDVETRQYEILSGLQQRRDEFVHSRLFPSLSDLVELKYNLEAVLRSRDKLSSGLPRQLTDVDWERKELVFEKAYAESPDVERMFQLSEWALPRITDAI